MSQPPITIPPYVQPVTGAGTLNGQREVAAQVRTIAAASTTIPVVYGEAQVGGRVFACTYTGGFWCVGALFCLGEIDSFTALYLDGVDVKPATPAGMTITYYTGTTSQTADATLASAISGYTNTLIYSTAAGSVGVAYVVLKYTDAHYSGFPSIRAKIKGRKVLPISANLSTWSEDITNAAWTLGNAESGRTADAGAAYTGAVTADKLTEATTNPAVTHFINSPQVSGLEPYQICTFSVFVKAVERSFVRVGIITKSAAVSYVTANLTTGLIENDSGIIDSSCVGYGQSWFRVSLTVNIGTGATIPRGRVILASSATVISYAGTIGSGVLLWGAQFEAKASPGVYTSTSGTASAAAWSDNPVLCARDLILTGAFGLGEDTHDLIAKATQTECDALVTTEKRRTLNIVLDQQRPISDWLDTLAAYCGGWIRKVGSQWWIRADRPAHLWQFTSSVNGWTAANGTVASGATAMVVTQTAGDLIIRSPSGLNICGATARFVRARVRRTSGAGTVDGAIFYVTAAHSETGNYYKAATFTAANNVWQILEWDMHAPTNGGLEWANSIITQIRIDLTQSVATDVWEVDWVSVGVEPVTTANVLRGSFSAGTTDSAQMPTVCKVSYTDTSSTEWRTRQAIVEMAGVSAGTTPRRESNVSLPGVTRYSQAYREATERLNKLDNALFCEFTTFDQGVEMQIGDVISVMHPYTDTAAAVQCDAATLFRITDASTLSPGRVKIRAVNYEDADYDNTESTTSWGAFVSRAGNLGGSGDRINRIQPRFAGGFATVDYDGQFPVSKDANIQYASVTAGSGAPDPTTGYYGAYALKISTLSSGTARTVWFGASSTTYTMPIDPNSKWLFSCKFWPRVGNTSVTATLKTSAAGTTYTLTDTTSTASAWNDFVDTASGSNLLNLVNDASGFGLFALSVNANSTVVWFDGIMLEKQIGEGAIVSPWRPPVASAINPARITPRLVAPGTLDDSVAIDDGNGNAKTIVAGVVTGTVTDGSSVTFSPTFARVPTVTFNPTALTYNSAYSAASHALVCEARSLTTSGFTAYIKVRQLATTITARTDTTPTDTGSGNLPRYTIQKAASALEAWDDRYTFNFDVVVKNIPSSEPAWAGYEPGQVVVGIYIATADSGSPLFTPTWTLVGSLSVNGLGGASATTSRTGRALTVVRDGLTQRGGTCPEFGIGITSELVSGGSVTFTSVTYETATAPTETSATAAGISPVPYTVIPT